MVDLFVGHVEDDQLLHRGDADPSGSGGLGNARQVDEHGASDSADDRCDSHGVETVFLPLDSDVVAWFVERLGRGTIDHRVSEVLLLEHVAELLDTPVRDQELQACLRPQRR